MDNCKNCKNPFSFKLVFKSFWAGYKDFSCTKCQTQYKFTFKDRLIGGVCIGISSFIAGLIKSYFELEIASQLFLLLLLLVILFIALSALSVAFLSFQMNEKETTHNN